MGIPETEWGDKEKLELVYFVERTIAGSIGPAAARVIVESYLSGLGSRMEDVFDLFGRGLKFSGGKRAKIKAAGCGTLSPV